MDHVREFKNLWNMKIIRIVVGAFGTELQSLVKRKEAL